MDKESSADVFFVVVKSSYKHVNSWIKSRSLFFSLASYPRAKMQTWTCLFLSKQEDRTHTTFWTQCTQSTQKRSSDYPIHLIAKSCVLIASRLRPRCTYFWRAWRLKAPKGQYHWLPRGVTKKCLTLFHQGMQVMQQRDRCNCGGPICKLCGSVQSRAEVICIS